MADILGRHSINNIHIIEVDTDPSASGAPAPKGSLASAVDVGAIWAKTGDADIDWQELIPFTGVSASAPLSGDGTTGSPLSLPAADTDTDGFLTSVDWNTFSGKEEVLSFSGPLSRSVNTISIPKATALVDGYLSSVDFASFAGKEEVLSFNAPLSRSSNTVSWDGLTISTDGFGYTPFLGTGTPASPLGIKFASNLQAGIVQGTDYSRWDSKVGYPGGLWPGGDSRPITMLGSTVRTVVESNITQSLSTGDVNINAPLDVDGAITSQASIAAIGDLSTLGSLSVLGTTTTGNLSVSGSSLFQDIVEITGFGGSLNTVTINSPEGQTGHALVVRNHEGVDQAWITGEGGIVAGKSAIFYEGFFFTSLQVSGFVSVSGNLSADSISLGTGNNLTVLGTSTLSSLVVTAGADIKNNTGTTPTLTLRRVSGQSGRLLSVVSEASSELAYITTAGQVAGSSLHTNGTLTVLGGSNTINGGTFFEGPGGSFDSVTISKSVGQSGFLLAAKNGPQVLAGIGPTGGLYGASLVVDDATGGSGLVSCNGLNVYGATYFDADVDLQANLAVADDLTVGGFLEPTHIISSGTANLGTVSVNTQLVTQTGASATFLDEVAMYGGLGVGAAVESGVGILVDGGSSVVPVRVRASFASGAPTGEFAPARPASVDIINEMQSDGALAGLTMSVRKAASSTSQIATICIQSQSANTYGPDILFLVRNGGDSSREVVRFRANGNVGIGTDNPGTVLAVSGLTSTGSFNTVRVDTATGNFYYLSSSAAFKRNIRDLDEEGAAPVLRLRPRRFDMVEGAGGAKDHVGLVMEEVAEDMPEALNRNSRGEATGVDFDVITTRLIQVVKRQEARIQALERRLSAA